MLGGVLTNARQQRLKYNKLLIAHGNAVLVVV